MTLRYPSRIGAFVFLLLAASFSVAANEVSATGPAPIDFTPNGTQPALNVGLDEPDACSGCHGGAFDPDDASQIAHSTWSGSMMANATRDPLFWAALDVANNDVPGVGDYCLRCHTPVGWLAGRVHKTGVPATPFVNGQNGCKLSGSLTDPDSEGNDFSGVTCHFCHRANETGPAGQPAIIANANLWIDDSLNCNTPDGGSFFGPCRKGPYTYSPQTAVQSPPHGWEHSSYIGSSQFCGACHDVSTPDTSVGPLKTLILSNGTDSGRPFPVERTYSEWLASDFANGVFANGFENAGAPAIVGEGSQTCQDCHMRSSRSATARACVFEPAGSRTNDLPVHEFVGANNWIPRILRDEYGLERVAAFNRTIGWAEEMLSQRSATVQTFVQSFAGVGSPLVARVRVTNRAGHKLPTGYSEGRRMWLNLRVSDGNGAPVFESGAYDPATGVLTADPQIKIYEIQQGEWNRNGNNTCDVDDGNGRKLFHFVLNNCVKKDNRIPPKGFRGGNNIEMQPVAYTYPEVSPGVLAHFDDTTYTVAIPPGTVLPVTVTGTLRFQIASKEYIEFLRDEATNNGFQSENVMCDRSSTVGPANQTRGQYMFDLWQKYDRAPPVNMGSASVTAGQP